MASQANREEHTIMDNSPYLDKPLFPLAVALPRMLAQIETPNRGTD